MVKTAHMPFSFPLDEHEIIRKRAVILARMLAMDEAFCSIPVTGIHPRTLDFMLGLYDDLFLNGFLKQVTPDLKVTISTRLTSAAGKFIYSKNSSGRTANTEIRMSGDYLMRLDKGPFSLNGLEVSSPQEAFLVVFEHELCHALEAAMHGQTGHSARFLQLAHGLFGHTATRHSLPTRKQKAAEQGLFAGSRVTFLYRDDEHTGIVTYVGKTATVMVPSAGGAYCDRQGRRYAKYRVPLSKLKIVL